MWTPKVYLKIYRGEQRQVATIHTPPRGWFHCLGVSHDRGPGERVFYQGVRKLYIDIYALSESSTLHRVYLTSVFSVYTQNECV